MPSKFVHVGFVDLMPANAVVVCARRGPVQNYLWCHSLQFTKAPGDAAAPDNRVVA
jgi:hypothetical protein